MNNYHHFYFETFIREIKLLYKQRTTSNKELQEQRLEVEKALHKEKIELIKELAEEFSKSKSRPVPEFPWSKAKFKMEDIGGLGEDTKSQINEIVLLQKSPERFKKLGARLPNGLLLVGPSGVGKTMLAHAIADKLNTDICNISSSMMHSFGDPVMVLNSIFKGAKEKASCVLFFDELEIIAQRRTNNRLTGMDTHIHLILTQLMIELEETENSKVLVIGATNRIEMIEPALLRKGRFERQIYIDIPGPSQRLEIMNIHSKNKALSSDVDLKRIAYNAEMDKGTSGFSGADLEEMLNESAIVAGMNEQTEITMQNIEKGINRVRKIMLQHSTNEHEGGMGRHLAQLYMGENEKVRFSNVGGLNKAKDELKLIVDFLKDPRPYHDADCRVPTGILLSGPPGIGKTLIARATAGEAGVPFFFVTGSEFVEMYVGVGAARVRDLFRMARRQNPCIIFIDEIDALATNRALGISGGSREYNHALNQLLSEMDGFEKHNSIVVMAATNQPDLLDRALLRPGRLESVIFLELPDEEERKEIIDIYLKNNYKLSIEEINKLIYAAQDKSGADIEGLINTARIHSVRNGRKGIIKWVDITTAMLKRIEKVDIERLHFLVQDYGMVKYFTPGWDAKGRDMDTRKTVFLVQDSYTEDVQINIAHITKILLNTYNIKTVFVESDIGTVNPTNTAQCNNEMLEKLVDEGKLKGPELLQIRDKDVDFDIYALDNENDYTEQYNISQKVRANNKKPLSIIEKIMGYVKNAVLQRSNEFYLFLNRFEQFDTHKIQFSSFLEDIKNISDELGVSYKDHHGLQVMIDSVKNPWKYTSEYLYAGDIYPQLLEMIEKLMSTIVKNNSDLSLCKDYYMKCRYLKRLFKLETPGYLFFDDIKKQSKGKKLEKEGLESIYNMIGVEIIELDDDIKLIDSFTKEAMKFYRITEQRSKNMAELFKEKMVLHDYSIFVHGGYHTQKLLRLLRKEFNAIVIAPKVDSGDKDNEAYFSIMEKQRTP